MVSRGSDLTYVKEGRGGATYRVPHEPGTTVPH